MRIAVDLMGGDQPPTHIYEATLGLPYEFVYLADEVTAQAIKGEVVIAEQTIEMGESPLFAVRRKKNSSLAVGMRLLKEERVDALLSTGNTGAIVAAAMLYLGMIPGIERPALLVVMPNGKEGTVVLDVGANITPKPLHLLQYAQMGQLYRKLFFASPRCTIGLLNIGVEERKGTKEVQKTYQLLRETFGSDFLGNIEGREVFNGNLDVMVTDGFTGNVFLKTCEGVSSFFIQHIGKEFQGAESGQIVSHFVNRYNYDKHPGAFLAGVRGIIVKCHGHSNRRALQESIKGAERLVKKKEDILRLH